MLGSIQTDKCVRLGAKESRRICKLHKKFELENIGAV